MDETTDNINEVISTNSNLKSLRQTIEFLKTKRKKDENRIDVNLDDDMIKRKRVKKLKEVY
jgi:hypothetical protein